jgi:hypothetical protein
MARLAGSGITFLAVVIAITCATHSSVVARGGSGAHGASAHAHARGASHASRSRLPARRRSRTAASGLPTRPISSNTVSHSLEHSSHSSAHELGSGWHEGRWHHERHHGRYGWWWAVGGIWYYYPEEIDGPPPYVSEIAIPQGALASEPDDHAFTFVERDRAIYYAPGDSVGVSYRTGTECAEAQRQAGGLGICLLK